MSDDHAAIIIGDPIPAPMIGGKVIQFTEAERRRRGSGARTTIFADNVTPTIDDVHALFVKVGCPPPSKEALMPLRDFLAMLKSGPPPQVWPLALAADAIERLKQVVEDLAAIEETLAGRILAGSAPDVLHDALSMVHTIRDAAPRLVAAVHPEFERQDDITARIIDNYARRAWATDGINPGGTRTNGPRVKFVGLALDAIGSTWLRGPERIRQALEGWEPKSPLRAPNKVTGKKAPTRPRRRTGKPAPGSR